MTTLNRAALFIELCAPSVQAVRWRELGYAVHPIHSSAIDRCEAEPSSLEQLVRAQYSEPKPGVLAIACDQLLTTRLVDTTDWNLALHQPLTRCFTAVRGLTPWISRHPQGHVVALLSRASLLPDATQGCAAVLGRALLGLFEALRAELRQTSTRVSIVITDAAESPDLFHKRLQHVLRLRSFYSLPASIDSEEIENYFAPMLNALSRTPRGVPMPAGPMGEVYHLHQLEDAHPHN